MHNVANETHRIINEWAAINSTCKFVHNCLSLEGWISKSRCPSRALCDVHDWGAKDWRDSDERTWWVDEMIAVGSNSRNNVRKEFFHAVVLLIESGWENAFKKVRKRIRFDSIPMTGSNINNDNFRYELRASTDREFTITADFYSRRDDFE